MLRRLKHMICSKCGGDNGSDTGFCKNCGAPLAEGKNVPSKKSKKALIIAVISGGVVLIAAALILLLFSGGAVDITGSWYNDTLGQTLVFNENSTVLITTAYGEKEAAYQYAEGKGSITVEGQKIPFNASGEKIIFISGGKETIFLRAEEGMDIANIIPTLTPVPVPSPSEVVSSSPDVSVSESASATAAPEESPSSSDAPALSYSPAISFQIGVLLPGDLFDIATAKSALLGEWYCGTGFGSDLVFYDNDTCDLIAMGETTKLSYVYTPASGNGRIYIDEADPDSSIDFHFDGTKVMVEGGFEYTRKS
jgi:hypothetical protein